MNNDTFEETTQPSDDGPETLDDIVGSLFQDSDDALSDDDGDESPSADTKDDGPEKAEDTDSDDDGDTAPDGSSEDSPKDTASWEYRYNELRSTKDRQIGAAYEKIDALRMELAELKGRLGGTDAGDDEPSTEDTPELPPLAELLDNPERLESYIQSRIKNGVDEALRPAQDVLSQQAALQSIHTEWEEYIEQDPTAEERRWDIKAVIDRMDDPNMTFEQADRIAKLFPGLGADPNTAAPESGATPAGDGAEDQDDPEISRMREKARRLRQPVSASTDADATPRKASAESITDAVEAAMDEVLTP